MPDMTWQPIEGAQTKGFLERITDFGDPQKQILKNESLSVIRAGAEPGTDRKKVGLVVGYVQSGKTMSLTCVSALARDNGYGHIIILCGVTKELFKQNMERVRKDLVTPSKLGFIAKENPRRTETEYYKGKFRIWKSTKDPTKNRGSTVITFLLKHANHINNLATVLQSISEHATGIPTLIIDDEAHMAGLNTAYSKEDESNVYKALKSLRSKIQDYAYLQYTATPQAPLLVHLADCVSPEFAIVLTPGEGYTGGKHFFPESINKDLIVDIPKKEMPEDGNAKLPPLPPESFIEAMRLFLVGVADNIAKGSPESYRSLLIHPHKEQKWHVRYWEFTKDFLKFSDEILTNGDNSEKDDFFKDMRVAYDELSKTCHDISDFESIKETMLQAIIEASSGITVVNANNREAISWTPANVLIGGEVLGVGFTVKGLTISYMLRTSPKGQIDSMQQRARFFGYRSKELSMTRVYLSTETHEAFRDYVKHEEGTREELRKMQAAGKSLKQWRRHFLVRAGMQLARSSIQSLSTFRVDAMKITHPQKPYVGFEEFNVEHLALLAEVTQNWGLQPDTKTKASWTAPQRYISGYFEAAKVLDEVVAKFNWSDDLDKARWDSNFLLLRTLSEECRKKGKEHKIKLMVMRPSEFGKSERGVEVNGWALQQGSNPGNGYPGDSHMADPNVTTVQLHCYTFVDNGNDKPYGRNIVVPIIIPAKSDKREMQMVMQG